MPPIRRLRTKPKSVEAVLFDGSVESVHAIEKFVGQEIHVTLIKGRIVGIIAGNMIAKDGDYIVKDASGGMTPCDPQALAEMYENDEALP